MTVGELIAELTKIPLDTKVFTVTNFEVEFVEKLE